MTDLHRFTEEGLLRGAGGNEGVREGGGGRREFVGGGTGGTLGVLGGGGGRLGVRGEARAAAKVGPVTGSMACLICSSIAGLSVHILSVHISKLD